MALHKGSVAGREEGRSRAVLVVERDLRLLELVTLTLRARGYTVQSSQDAQEALTQLQGSTPALIVLGDPGSPSPGDVGDVGRSGSGAGGDSRATFLQRVRRVPRLQGTKLLLLEDAQTSPEALELAHLRLRKPFTGGQLGRAAEALLTRDAPSAAAPAHKQHTVMVIEDSAALRGLIGDILHRQGYLVESAETVPQARALIQSHAEQVSLILLDVNLPGGTGFELLKLIRERSEVPVFILSALRQEEQMVRGQALGAQAFIEKPFNPRELVEKIRATLT